MIGKGVSGSIVGMSAIQVAEQVQARRIPQLMRKVNRSELARELNLDRSHVSLVLNGKRMPSLGVAAGMAKRMGVTLDELHWYLASYLREDGERAVA